MRITGISLNADGNHLGGSLSRLEESLELARHCGFDGVEIAVHGLDVILGGRLRQAQLDAVRAITDRFDFIYTVHAPDRLNLAFPQIGPDGKPELAHEKDVFVASLDFCAAIGANMMVYHNGLIALYEVDFPLKTQKDGQRFFVPSDEALERARKQEVLALRELAPLAAERGVMIAMENRCPHAWEIAALVRAGLPAEELLKYHAGLTIPGVVQQVEAVDHPNLGVTLDFAHLFLTANHCGFDYLAEIREVAPYVRHLHGSDNFGRVGGAFDSLVDCLPYGDGDMHLLPGWGAIPQAESLAQLPDYEGLYVLELRPRFSSHFIEALQMMRETIREVAGEGSLARV